MDDDEDDDDDEEDDDEDDSDEWTTDDDDDETESDSGSEETAARKSAARGAGAARPSQQPKGPEVASQDVLKFLRQQLPRPVLLSRSATSLTLSVLARKDALEARPLKGKVGLPSLWVCSASHSCQVSLPHSSMAAGAPVSPCLDGKLTHLEAL